MKTKNTKQTKQGISLIVLVITIIVMIILAAAVILSLSSSGIIGRANEAVTETNLRQVTTLAQTIWSEIYIENMEGKNLNYATEVPKRLEEQGIDITKFEIVADSNGVTVELSGIDKTGPEITILTPESSDETNPTVAESTTYIVTGKVSDRSGVNSLTVNDTAVVVNEDGSWTHTLTLVQNEVMEVIVVASDKLGNTTTKTGYVGNIQYVSYEFTASNYDNLMGTTTQTDAIVRIPATFFYNGRYYKTTSIGKRAFYNRTNLTSIYIPESVTTIGEEAFKGCTKLTFAYLPESVTSLGGQAFRGCNSITSVGPAGSGADIEIPNSVDSIVSSLFHACTNLTSVVIPNGITSIGQSAFWGCTNLTNVTVGDNSELNSIGVQAFYNCEMLTKVIIPDSVTSIGASAFYSCKNIISVDIPKSVTSIDQNAFRNCSGLINITFDSNSRLTSIGKYAFAGSGLTNIDIPKGVTSIDESVFGDCESLASISIHESVTTIGGMAFSRCYNLTSIDFSGTMEQWNAIVKSDGWNFYTPAIQVVCADGIVAL